jgi:putative nucleotidyltransferase with HDIG domain
VELGLEDSELEELENGALLHDIGLAYVPEQILMKPSSLDDSEWEILRKHTTTGAALLQSIGFHQGAAAVVEQHHEKWDGSGYPRAISGAAIDLKARIFAVADCLEGMTTERPYRMAKSYSEVCDEMRRCAGSHFDPAVVDAFLAIPETDWQRIRSRS